MVDLGAARAALLVPLRKGDAVLGYIQIYRQEVGLFSDKQIALLTNFAAQAVIAIENVRLITELRQRTGDLQESLAYQTATAEILRIVIGASDDLQPVLDTMLEKATALCDADGGHLLLHKDAALDLVAIRNPAPGLADALRNVALTGERRPYNVLIRMAQAKAPVHIEDLRDEPAYRDREPVRVAMVEIGGARTLIAVPLLRRGELIGAFIIYRRGEPRPFAVNQIALVTTFADQAVIAIENARLVSELRQKWAKRRLPTRPNPPFSQ